MATATMTRPTPRVVGGVCSGFAAHTGLPVGAVRLATAVLVVCGGAGLLLYAWLWATVPSAAAGAAVGSAPLKSVLTSAADVVNDEATASARRAPVVEILLGVALLVAAGAVVAARMGAAVPLEVVVPGVVVVTGAALAWRQFDALRNVRTAGSSALVVRALGALVLVVLGILLFFTTSSRPNVWTVLTAAVAVLVGVAVVVAPWVVRLVRDLAEERAARVRDLERAEIAAHLHDSVLQTLALIQQKAEPGSDAARLARAQERELRSWLFTEQAEPARDLGTRAAGRCRGHRGRVPRPHRGHRGRTRPQRPAGRARRRRPRGDAQRRPARRRRPCASTLETAGERVERQHPRPRPGLRRRLRARGPATASASRSSAGCSALGGHATIAPGPGRTGTEVRLTLPLAPVAQDEEHA